MRSRSASSAPRAVGLVELGSRAPRSTWPRSIVARAAGGDRDLRALGARDAGRGRVLGHDRHQPPVLRRVGVERAHAAQLDDALRVVDGVDQVPGREVEVDRARHFARRRAVDARPERAVAEQRQDARELDAPVEVGAGDVDAVVGEDVGLAVDPAARARARRERPRSRTCRRRCRRPAPSPRASPPARGRTRRRSARTGTRPRESRRSRAALRAPLRPARRARRRRRRSRPAGRAPRASIGAPAAASALLRRWRR